MSAQIYSKLVAQASKAGLDITDRSRKSVAWLRAKYSEITKNSVVPAKFIDQTERKRNVPKVGRMYMFVYDPKGKDTLPFYDRFPLIYFVEPAQNGFYGINLHYLPPILRAKLMDSLYETQVNGVVSNETTKLKISYQLLKAASRFRWFKPCFKMYLFEHMRSKFIYVPPEEWDATVFLPTEQFRKATREEVWKDSRSKI